MNTRALALVLLLLDWQAALAAAPDAYAPRTSLDADTVLLLDAWGGRADAVERLRARLAAKPAPQNAADAWLFLCRNGYHTGLYAQAVSDCEMAARVDPEGGTPDTLAIVRLLAKEPAVRAQSAARVPMHEDERVAVRAGGYSGDAIADTGAEISVMMQSAADAAHVRVLGDSRAVHGTTGTVAGKIGIIPQVVIGHAIAGNVPVLILPDTQLVLTSGKATLRIPFILGLYALADFGRIAFLDHNKTLALGSAAPMPFANAAPMVWHPLGIAVPLQGPGGARAAHFDSGANVSYLYPAALPLLAPDERARIEDSTRKIGGVGGVVEERVQRLPLANLALAGQPLQFQNIDVAAQPPTGEAARLGDDMMQKYTSVVLDFATMTISVAR